MAMTFDTYKDEVLNSKGSIPLIKDKNEFIGSNPKEQSKLYFSNSLASLTEEFIDEGVALDSRNTDLISETKATSFSSTKNMKIEQKSSNENSADFKALDYLPTRSAGDFGVCSPLLGSKSAFCFNC